MHRYSWLRRSEVIVVEGDRHREVIVSIDDIGLTRTYEGVSNAYEVFVECIGYEVREGN
jgi:hypothetical protein